MGLDLDATRTEVRETVEECCRSRGCTTATGKPVFTGPDSKRPG